MASKEDDNKLPQNCNINNDRQVNIISVYKRLEFVLNNRTESFTNKVESLIEVWKQVSQCHLTEHKQYVVHLMDWLKLHTLNIVLTGDWKKLKDTYEERLLKEVKYCEMLLMHSNNIFSLRCRKLAEVIKDPWGSPVLGRLLNEAEVEIGPEEIEFFGMETGYLISTRLRKLCESHCEDLALNLVTSFMRCHQLAEVQNINLNATEDQKRFIMDVYIALLYKYKKTPLIISTLKSLSLREGLELLKRFAHKRVNISKIWRHSSRIAHLAAQVYVTAAVMKSPKESSDVLEGLLDTWLFLNEGSENWPTLTTAVRRIIQAADSAIHMYIFCEAFYKKFGSLMKTFIIELYIRALTTDMNDLERQKNEDNAAKLSETSERLAHGFLRLADVLNEHLKVSRECVLTSFSLKPAQSTLDRIVNLAKSSGYEVLDTGQNWKCKLHPPVDPSEEVSYKCNECGEFMTQLKTKSPLNTNTALSEALTEEQLGLSPQLCDDLVVVLSSPRYQLLSWLVNWKELHRLCVLYLNDPLRTKNITTELKFLDIDYSIFATVKREPEDEDVNGIERGYEHYLEDLYPEPCSMSSGEETSAKDANVNSSHSISDSFQLLPPPTPKSDPKVLKSLRLFRPNLKRAKVNQSSDYTSPPKVFVSRTLTSPFTSAQTTLYGNYGEHNRLEYFNQYEDTCIPKYDLQSPLNPYLLNRNWHTVSPSSSNQVYTQNSEFQNTSNKNYISSPSKTNPEISKDVALNLSVKDKPPVPMDLTKYQVNKNWEEFRKRLYVTTAVNQYLKNKNALAQNKSIQENSNTKSSSLQNFNNGNKNWNTSFNLQNYNRDYKSNSETSRYYAQCSQKNVNRLDTGRSSMENVVRDGSIHNMNGKAVSNVGVDFSIDPASLGNCSSLEDRTINYPTINSVQTCTDSSNQSIPEEFRDSNGIVKDLHASVYNNNEHSIISNDGSIVSNSQNFQLKCTDSDSSENVFKKCEVNYNNDSCIDESNSKCAVPISSVDKETVIKQTQYSTSDDSSAKNEPNCIVSSGSILKNVISSVSSGASNKHYYNASSVSVNNNREVVKASIATTKVSDHALSNIVNMDVEESNFSINSNVSSDPNYIPSESEVEDNIPSNKRFRSSSFAIINVPKSAPSTNEESYCGIDLNDTNYAASELEQEEASNNISSTSNKHIAYGLEYLSLVATSKMLQSSVPANKTNVDIEESNCSIESNVDNDSNYVPSEDELNKTIPLTIKNYITSETACLNTDDEKRNLSNSSLLSQQLTYNSLSLSDKLNSQIPKNQIEKLKLGNNDSKSVSIASEDSELSDKEENKSTNKSPMASEIDKSNDENKIPNWCDLSFLKRNLTVTFSKQRIENFDDAIRSIKIFKDGSNLDDCQMFKTKKKSRNINFQKTIDNKRKNILDSPTKRSKRTIKTKAAMKEFDFPEEKTSSSTKDDGSPISVRKCTKMKDRNKIELDLVKKYKLKEARVVLHRLTWPDCSDKKDSIKEQNVQKQKSKPILKKTTKKSENMNKAKSKGKGGLRKSKDDLKPWPLQDISPKVNRYKDAKLDILKDKCNSDLKTDVNSMNPCVVLKRLEFDKDKKRNATSVFAQVPGLNDLQMIRPSSVDRIVQVVQVPGARTTTNVSIPNTQTSTQVTPHIQRIGQPRTEKPVTTESEATTTNTNVGTSTGATSTSTESPTLINILSQQIIRPANQNNCVNLKPRSSPLINILSQQIIKPATTVSNTKVTSSTGSTEAQVKERSSTNAPTESSPQSDSNETTQQISVTYLNQSQKINCAPVVVVSSYCNVQPAASPSLSVTSQGSSSPCVTPAPTLSLSSKTATKSPKSKSVKSTTTHATKASPIPKPQQKPQEDEHTTQRIFDILAEYAEQLRNSPDLNNKPAPRRRSNPPTNPNQNAKRKKSSTSKKTGQSSNSLTSDGDLDDTHTVGSEDSSCGVVQISVQDDEQPLPSVNTSESSEASASPQQLILTDSTPNQSHSLIIADSNVGEALKMSNTAVLVPGNYIMPVSMVKGGQQIAVVSGGSKILATVPARSGPNMLLFQSFLNQTRKHGLPTVKYSTIQPISGITRNISGVTTQSTTSVPVTTQNLTAVTLSPSVGLQKINQFERVEVNNFDATEVFLAISQPQDNKTGTEQQQSDHPNSTNGQTVRIDDDAGKSENSFDEEKSAVATSVIAQTNNIKGTATEQQSSTAASIMELNLNSTDNDKDATIKVEGRVQSVLVATGTSNGPMLSHNTPTYNKQIHTVNSVSESNKDEYLRNEGKVLRMLSHIDGQSLLFNQHMYSTVVAEDCIL